MASVPLRYGTAPSRALLVSPIPLPWVPVSEPLPLPLGMLTITDFINILRHHYKSPIVSPVTCFLRLLTAVASLQVGMDELENQTIQMFRDSERAVAKLKSSLVQIDPMQRYVSLNPPSILSNHLLSSACMML